MSNKLLKLHFQLDFSLHDFFDNFFRGGLTTTEPIDGFNHLPICGMFVAKSLGTRIIDVMLLGNPIQMVNSPGCRVSNVSVNASPVPCTDSQANEIPVRF